MRFEDAPHFRYYHVAFRIVCIAREGALVAFEILFQERQSIRRGQWIADAKLREEIGENRLSHRLRLVFVHQCYRLLFLVRVRLHLLHLRFRKRRLGGIRPARIAVVTAIVRIPAEHIPKLRPRLAQMLFRTAAGEHTRGEQPRCRVSSSGCMLVGDLFRRHDAKMHEQFFHARDALPRRARVPTLPPESSTLARETIVSAEDHRAATKKLRWLKASGKHGPTEGAMADIKGNLDVRRV